MTESSTRDRLIDAAYAVVARDGLDAASVKTIAAEARVTPGLMHYHFPCKDALMEAALRRGLDAYVARSQALRATHTGEKLLDIYFAQSRAAFTEEAEYFRVRLAFAARAMTHPALAAVLADVNAVAIAETARTLAAAAGRKTSTKADRALATAVKAAFDGYMLASLTNPDFPRGEAAALLTDAIRNALRR